MRVSIVVDASALTPGESDEELAVTSVGESAEAVRAALRRAGHDARIVPLADEPTALLAAALSIARESDAVFELAESLGRSSEGEVAAAWLLALTGVPVTGSPPRALALCREKPVARAVLAAHGVPVPEGVALPRPGESDEALLAALPYPAIVKPAAEDASHGIDEGSVVASAASALERVREVVQRYGSALVEELVEGREIQVAALGRAGQDPTLLPFGEIDYAALPEGSPRILTYAAKWDEASDHYQKTPAIAARPLAKEQDEAIRLIATRAWHALGLGGYARIDLRVHAERGPFVIDVNPNPDLSPGAGLALAAERAGMTHDQLVLRILDLASPAASG